MKPSSKRCRALALARRKTLLRTETRMVRSGRSTISVVSGVSGTRPSPDYGNTSRCPRMRFPRRKRLPTVLGRRRHPLHRRSVFHGALSSWLCWLAAESPGSFSADAVPPRMRKRLGRTFQNTLRRSRRQSRRLAISGQLVPEGLQPDLPVAVRRPRQRPLGRNPPVMPARSPRLALARISQCRRQACGQRECRQLHRSRPEPVRRLPPRDQNPSRSDSRRVFHLHPAERRLQMIRFRFPEWRAFLCIIGCSRFEAPAHHGISHS